MNLTARLGLNVTDFVSGLVQAENQSNSSFERVRREMARVQSSTQKMADSLRSPFEKLQARLSGLQIPEWQSDKLKQAFDENEMNKGVIAAEKMLQTLRQQAAEYGKSTEEIQKMRLKAAGANDIQMKNLELLQSTIAKRKEEQQAIILAAKADEQRAKYMSSVKSNLTALIKFQALNLGVGSIRSIIDMADGYTQLSARIKNATQSTTEMALVQQRLSENSKSTYRSLQEATESYLSISGSLKAVGYSTKEILDFNDSLTFAFTANATSAQTADTAINALTRSFAKGAVDSHAWTAVLLAVPNLAKNIADELGVSESEVRKLGASGKISVDTLVSSLSKARDANKALADSMSVSLKDGFQYFKNALSEYLGSANNAYSVTNTLASGVKLLADNINVLANAVALYLGYKAVAYFRLMTTSITAKTAAIGKSALAWATETAAISANTKALAANAVARAGGALGVGKIGSFGRVAAGGAGALLGGGALTGAVAWVVAGLYSAYETVNVAIGKQSETVASRAADGLTRFLSGVFGDGQSLSLGDWAFRNFTFAGRDETRRYNEMLRQEEERQKQQALVENALSSDYKNVRAGLSELGEEIKKQTEQFNQSTIAMKLAEKRLKLDEIKSSGKDNIDSVLKLENELKALEIQNQLNINKQGQDYIKSLQEQALAIGKTSEELELLKLSAAGVSNSLIEQAKLQQEENKKLQNQLELQNKINNLLEQNERFGKSERELFQLDVEKLAGGDKDLISKAMDAWDKNNYLKEVADIQKQSSETFSSAVDKFANNNSDNSLSDFEKEWQSYFDKLSKMSYSQQQAFFKQEQLNLPSYSSVTAEQFDNAVASATDELNRFFQGIEENHNALRIQSIEKMAGLTPDTGALPENLSLDSNTAALAANTAALEKIALRTNAAAVSTPATQNPTAALGGQNIGSLTLNISTDNEKLAGKITATQTFIQAFSRLFSSNIDAAALMNA